MADALDDKDEFYEKIEIISPDEVSLLNYREPEVPSLPTVLTLVFIALKFMGVIEWSWWWVFSPWLVQVAFGAILFAAAIATDSIE